MDQRAPAASPAGAIPMATVAVPAAAKPVTPPTAQPRPKTMDPEKARLLAAMDDFSRWATQFTNSSASLVEGQRLAWKRREAMLDLIQTEPEQALAMAIPFELRQSLPPQITKYLEQPLDGRGDFNVAIGTDFAVGAASVYRHVVLGGTNYQAYVYGRRLAQSCASGIPLHGIALDGKMAVSSSPLRVVSLAEATALARRHGQPLDKICSVSGQSVNSRNSPVYAESGGGILCCCGTDHYDYVSRQWELAESGGTAGAGGETPPQGGVGGPVNDDWTHGTKTVLYMRVNFPDDLTVPIDEGAAYSIMDSVNAFYNAVSYDVAALDTTVTPVVTLPQVKAYYSTDPGLLLADARAMVKQAGYDTANFDRDIVTFTPVPGYTFGGLAYVGGKGVWLQSAGAGVTAHELGHNYGLWHANFWDTTTNFSMIGPGTNLEYGNLYDTMGAANAGIYQFNAVHRGRLDWLKADAVQVIASNSVYRVFPYDVPAAARQAGRNYAAAVQKDALRYYWLEFRQLFTANPWAENGLMLNWTPWPESNGGSQLIDTTPGSPNKGDTLDSRDDAALVIGRTFNDNAAGVHVTPLVRSAINSDPYIDCQVNVGTFPGNQPPVMTLRVDNTNVPPGTLVHCYVTASDPDGDALAYAWSFDDLTFSTNNQPWISKTFAGAGEHVVRCVVSDMKGGEASANAVVTVGGATGFRVTGRVTDINGTPLEGVLVGNGTLDASRFIGGWTDSDGRYVLVNTGSTNFNLAGYQFGYTFTGATNWSNPLQPTNQMEGIDFVGTALPMVNIVAGTNLVAKSDTSVKTLVITSTGPTNNDFPVRINLAGSGTLGTDYTLNPDLSRTNILIIPAGTNSVTVRFRSLNNPLAVGSETATVTLLDDDANYTAPTYALAPPAEATITLFNDNPPVQQSVTIATATPEISEDGVDDGEFVFSRSGSTQNSLLVNYSVGGTATAGTDYAPMAGSVIVPAGQASATVFLQPFNDHYLQTNEVVTATVAASAAYTISSPSAASIVILPAAVNTVTVLPITEPANSVGTFALKRDGDLTDALTVSYTVSGSAIPGTDYAPLRTNAVIPAGLATINVSFIALFGTNLVTPGKYVTVTLTNDYNYLVGTPGSATISITPNVLPTVNITAPVSSVSEQGDTFGEFQITRSTTTGDLTVYLALSGTAAPGWNYLPLDNPVVIPDGSGSVTLDLIPFQDAVLDTNLTVQLNVQANTNYNVGDSATATISILDDGTSQIPGVGFCFASSAYPESQSPGIAVSLTAPASQSVTVSYKVIAGGTAPTSRYSLPQGSLTIGSNTMVGFVPLQINNDTNVEPPQTVKVVLFNPTNASLSAIRVHTYTILDDDAAAVSVMATVTNASETGPVPGNFRISRAGPTNASQQVNFEITGTASAPADYAPLGTSATILAGASYVDLPVVPTVDNAPRPAQTVVLTLINATNGAIVSPNVATVTITDNNTNPLPVVTVTSTNGADAVVGGGNGLFTFTRTGPTGSSLTVSFGISGTAPGNRYAPLTNAVTFAAGQSTVSLPVVALENNHVEGDQTVVVTLNEAQTYISAYPSSAAVTIQDSDQVAWIDASVFYSSKYGPIPGQFTFSRFGSTNNPVTINYSIGGTASNGFDYVQITNFIIIPAGQITVTLPILPQHTGKVEGPVTVTLTLLANTNYGVGTPASATVTIDDDMPMLTIFPIVPSVLEGGSSNGVFRLIRTGDPKYDFTAYLGVGGTASYGTDYVPFPTNVYFTCGETSVDLEVSTINNLLVDGDHTVIATILTNAAYTVLAPSNALINILDAGTNATPIVQITTPESTAVFIDNLGPNGIGLILNATVTDPNSTNDVLTWVNLTGSSGYFFDDPTTNNTTVTFTNTGFYQLRLIADNGVLQGYAELDVYVGTDPVPSTITNLLHWRLDEGIGTNVLDSSGFGRNGGFDGQPDWGAGIINDALFFNGTNDCVRQTDGTNTLNGLNAFTLAMWIHPPPTNVSQGFFTGDDMDTNDTVSLATHTSATCGNALNDIETTVTTAKGTVRRASLSGAMHPGQWEHVAVTWTNGEAPSLYINGIPDQPNAGFTALSGTVTNCAQFIIAKGAWDSPASWAGGIDEVRVFNEVLSPALIAGLAEAPTTNHAPYVNAGTNFTVQTSIPITLVGTVSDDGLPNPPGMVTTLWTYLGTNNITITNPASLTNSFVFDTPGDYVFRLTASDGEVTTFADVTVTVIPPTIVDITADIPDAYDMGPVSGDFTITQTGSNALAVYYTVSGTASNGVDYVSITNVAFIPDGSNSVSIPVLPILNYHIKGDQQVTLTLVTNIAYFIGNGQASVTIHDSPYGVWSIQHFTLEELTQPQVSGAGADFSGDGIVNFAKYAFNLNPRVQNAKPPYAWDFETDTNDNRLHLTLTYSRWLPPRVVEYAVYVSTNMIDWDSDTNHVKEFWTTNNPDGTTETVKTRAWLPYPGPTNLFMNIRIWLGQVPAPPP